MALIVTIVLGIAAAGLVHWSAWWMRLHHRQWSALLGVLGAAGVTALGLIYLLSSDIGHIVQPWLILFWGSVLVIGLLQARAIPAPWWMGILGLFFEATLGFLVLSAANLSLQRAVLQWRLAERFPETFARPSLIVERFIVVFLVMLLVLALLRPVVRLRRSRPQAGGQATAV